MDRNIKQNLVGRNAQLQKANAVADTASCFMLEKTFPQAFPQGGSLDARVGIGDVDFECAVHLAHRVGAHAFTPQHAGAAVDIKLPVVPGTGEMAAIQVSLGQGIAFMGALVIQGEWHALFRTPCDDLFSFVAEGLQPARFAPQARGQGDPVFLLCTHEKG